MIKNHLQKTESMRRQSEMDEFIFVDESNPSYEAIYKTICGRTGETVGEVMWSFRHNNTYKKDTIYLELFLTMVDFSKLSTGEAKLIAEYIIERLNYKEIDESENEKSIAASALSSILCQSSNPIKTIVILIGSLQQLQKNFKK